MKKLLFIFTLLASTKETLADIHFVNNTGSQMDYRIGSSYSGCSNSPNGGSYIATQPGSYLIEASTCTNWSPNNQWQTIGTFTVDQNNNLLLTCNSPTTCSSSAK